ncbi:hypothetical protein F5Y05DRAFT_362753 [Hypoxylon sp. FL0543]|nr:hypothetical protein F5Y05DRAFT_362753 [Hypoxylon sp. FL0543]
MSSFTAFAPLFQLNHQISNLQTDKTAVNTGHNDGTAPPASSTASPLALHTFTANSSQRQGLSASIRDGIGFGIILGIIVLVAVIFSLLRSTQGRRGPIRASTTNGSKTTLVAELEAPTKAAEMSADRSPTELEAAAARHKQSLVELP